MLKEKAQANELLKFSIALLRGEHGWVLRCNRNQRIRCAESIADRLAENGFWWQAQILYSWIYRCRRGDFDVDVKIRLEFTRAQHVICHSEEKRERPSY